MKKRVIIFVVGVVLIVVGIVAALVACGDAVKELKPDSSVHVEGFYVLDLGDYKVVVDKETGVEYLIYIGMKCATITPLYNADGTLKVYKEKQE